MEDPPIQNNTPLDFLCLGNDESERNAMVTKSIGKLFQVDQIMDKQKNNKNSASKTSFIDYHIFDLSGNHISTLRNVQPRSNLKDILYRKSLRTGIYFVRFWNGNKISTEKVFIQ